MKITFNTLQTDTVSEEEFEDFLERASEIDGCTP